MNRVLSFMHIESPSSFSMLLYESQSSLSVPAIYYSPDIFLILFLAKDSLVMYFRGGKLTILSIVFEEIESFSTLVRVLKTLVSSLSMGGV